MNKNELLNSGLLESFVLGVTTDEERQQVEEALVIYPDLKVILSELELALEKSAFDNKIDAPQGVKAKILQEISSPPGSNKSEDPSIQHSRGSFNYLPLAASFLAGTIISVLGLWFWVVGPNKETVTQLESELVLLEEKCAQENDFYAFINDGNTIPVRMRSVNNQIDHGAICYWNNEVRKGLIRVINLPQLESDLVYQIWADVEGEMISLGMLNYESSIANYIDLKYLPNAESINITIEPAGGSDHPTVENLVIAGAI